MGWSPSWPAKLVLACYDATLALPKFLRDSGTVKSRPEDEDECCRQEKDDLGGVGYDSEPWPPPDKMVLTE